ncbi:MAG TPA: carbonic anhydrase [Acidimicrobiia bacterium]|nr:carbonic anhydrase [Acidimicrobiia bacterium]
MEGNQSRRAFLGSGLAVAGGVLTAGALPAGGRLMTREAVAAPADGAAAIRRLQAGNRRFVAGRTKALGRFDARRAELVEGQAPFAIILGCSDSRVPPEIVFDEGLGDLFLVRVAGNTGAEPLVIGSIEYAASILGSVLVMVLGHDDCGAVKAAVDVATKGTVLPGNLMSVAQPIVPAVQAVRSQPADALVEAAIHENVRQTVSALGRVQLLADLVTANKLTIVGAEYRLKSGKVDLIKP